MNDPIRSGSPLQGKVALITGASSGIGEATALVLAQAGMRLALVARRRDKLEQLRARIAALGGEAGIVVADVAQESQAVAAVGWALDTFGAVDVLVNNAGIIRPGTVASQNSQEWRDTFDTNLLGPLYMTQAVLADMRRRGSGHIVNISSNAARIPGGATQASYAASKYAITAFSSSLRKEVAAEGIRVTIIEPGTTATEVASSIPDDKTREWIDSHVHKPGAMLPEDIAAAIHYAISQPARVNVNEIWLTPTQG